MSNQTLLNLNERVWEIVKKIPKGKVTTYGEIAIKLGNPKLSRQVGWALHANKSSEVPCHRVVDRNGRLAPNFAFNGAKEHKRRLEVEGVKFVDEMHVDLFKYFWKDGKRISRASDESFDSHLLKTEQKCQ